jgi:hypothetical protein
VLQALNAVMDAQYTRDYDDTTEDAAKNVTAVTSDNENRFAQRRADTLTTMAETALCQVDGSGLGPQPSTERYQAKRYQVVVHVTAETLTTGADGRCELDNGPRLAPGAAIPKPRMPLSRVHP